MKWKFTLLLFITLSFAARNVSAQSVTYYVSNESGNDNNTGLSMSDAFKSMRKAVVVMRQSTEQEVIIKVDWGSYLPYDEGDPPANVEEATFLLFRNQNNQAGKSLKVLGGYDFQTGTRDIARNPTRLRGRFPQDPTGANHVVTLGLVNSTADSLVIEGFEIMFGTENSTGDADVLPGQLLVPRSAGGGMSISYCTNNKIAIRNCIFANSDKRRGGAIYMGFSTGINFQNCVFSGNGATFQSSDQISGQGGVAYIVRTDVNFLNCIFNRNSGPDTREGSIMFIGNSLGETVKLTNCTVTGNSGLAGFNTFYVQNGNLQIANSIIWSNGGLHMGKGPANANISLSNTLHEWANEYGQDSKWATGGIQFRNPGNPIGSDGDWFTADDGLQIAPCTITPAIDGGINSDWPSALTTDITGRPRIVAGRIDLGAYEEQTSTVFQLWPDVDSDGWGDEETDPVRAHCMVTGYVNRAQDCDDDDNTVYQGAPEICDGKDNDCNGRVDDIHNAPRYFPDADGDGHGDKSFNGEVHCPLPGYVTSSDDCNDNDNTAWENAPELCDGKDNNCDGHIDDHIILRYYLDNDHDGYGGGGSIESCAPVAGRVTQDGDCDDNDNTIYPGAPELCDGKNNNCNAYIDDGQQVKQYLDNDHDGYGNPNFSIMSCPAVAGRILRGGDCDDNDNTIYPGAGGCAALPLTLVDFTIKEQGQKAVALWTTTDEVNTHHFDLEKSADGNQFLKIATLPAMNAPGDHNYSYIDPQSFAGKNYYRIKMVDLDGTYTYSRIASLHGNDTRAVSAIYPNPASDIVNVVIEESSNDLSVQLISIDGKLIQTKRLAVRGTYQLNVAKLPAGIYFIKVSNGETYKLIKQDR